MAIVQNGLTAKHARYMSDKAVRDKHAPEHAERLNNILDGIESKSKKGEYYIKITLSRELIDSLVMQTLQDRGFAIEYPEAFDFKIPFNVTIRW